MSHDGSPIYSRKCPLTCSNCLKLILVWPYLRHRRCTYCWQTIFTSWLCVCSIGSSRVYNSWKLHWKLSLASRAARTSSKSLRNGSAATRMSCRTELGNRADLQGQSMWSLWAQHMNSNHCADKKLAPWRSGLELLYIKNMRTLSMILALLLKLVQNELRQDPPLDLSFWSFLTFLHHGIEEVERHLLWKFYNKMRRKSWSNVPPKLVACIGFLYKVVHKIGRLRKFNRSRGI